MRQKPGTCVAADGTRGMKATVFDTSKLYCSPITVQWMGQRATEFYDRHKDELIPGRCLRLELFHFISKQDTFYASVKACEMAPPPPSWLKHGGTSSPAPSLPSNNSTSKGLRLV